MNTNEPQAAPAETRLWVIGSVLEMTDKRVLVMRLSHKRMYLTVTQLPVTDRRKSAYR